MTCKIWNVTEGVEEMTIPLHSVGTAVCVHKENPDWVFLLVFSNNSLSSLLEKSEKLN